MFKCCMGLKGPHSGDIHTTFGFFSLTERCAVVRRRFLCPHHSSERFVQRCLHQRSVGIGRSKQNLPHNKPPTKTIGYDQPFPPKPEVQCLWLDLKANEFPQRSMLDEAHMQVTVPSHHSLWLRPRRRRCSTAGALLLGTLEIAKLALEALNFQLCL